ncbi:hypothetical protein B0T26DRAFT_634081 [Lasiosphaeria miniovina]|uniref:Uncharacterized protein n=1 Tax=Lasiosphaeria miniovina TaxID=1954250 RepID=A0AA40EBE0_9PEZI|nr:uncharacterized protein B0T26DRAFT_634081 [Lasiosphaeria miniovina]KAK0733775.1 hypothetical protein B0T26DRAFT_634081 [Lasiosphaeria miniovina]
MGHSFNRAHTATNIEPPPQWQDITTHKYCKRVDLGRLGKPNKAQKCDECLAVKAASSKANQRDAAARRQEKLSWGLEGNGVE